MRSHLQWRGVDYALLPDRANTLCSSCRSSWSTGEAGCRTRLCISPLLNVAFEKTIGHHIVPFEVQIQSHEQYNTKGFYICSCQRVGRVSLRKRGPRNVRYDRIGLAEIGGCRNSPSAFLDVTSSISRSVSSILVNTGHDFLLSVLYFKIPSDSSFKTFTVHS